MSDTLPGTVTLRSATPMIHVPDVRATAAWYASVGFTVLETYDDGELELARITVWEPGSRVEWESSVDDVTGRSYLVKTWVDPVNLLFPFIFFILFIYLIS